MAKLELDASRKGWRCSACGLPFDCIGRPVFGDEPWTIKTTSINWLENRPKIRFCPNCGEAIEKERGHGGKKEG